MAERMGRLAIDIGGTFTDLVHFNEDSGDLEAAKTLSTPGDLTQGVLNTIEYSGIDPNGVAFFVHGGTTVINAITERKGVRTALVTTAGFRDVLEIARGNRPDMYNFRFQKPVTYVPRRWRYEVRERIDPQGNEITPVDRTDLEAIVAQCQKQQIEAIAIQFLHSYVAPEHEAECAAFLREKLPDVSVTASHEITREWREYERANTTVLNAYVQPIVQHYFTKLEGALHKLGIDCPFTAMQSNGGTTSFGWAKAHPITLIESGPAAGVNGAALIGEYCDEANVIYFDVGGTTVKCSVIEDGTPKVTTDYKLEWSRLNPGYPVRVPVADLVEIGAGGGSIAHFDAAGSLRVGPQSAGADPGPACYGLGGTQPTVTDAKLLTGVLNPDNFAGGQITLDVERARQTMQPIADGLDTDVEGAAAAIIRVVEANMINALKLVSIQRGHDPRDFVFVAAGGGGPMHAAPLGRELGVKETIIPRYPGYFSAWGMLATKPRRDFAITALTRVDNTTIEGIHAVFAGLETEAKDYFAAVDNAPSGALEFARSVDMRYLGQEHSVTVPVAGGVADIETILMDFHAAHERAYTFSLSDTPVELVTFRLAASASVPLPRLNPIDAKDRSADAAHIGKRMVDFGEDGSHEADIYNRDRLPPEFEAPGPLVIEEASTMTIIHPGQRLRVDGLGFLRIREIG
jgi:N-methylhydantoinase A